MSAPEWITDRLPTEADGDADGEVVVLGNSECGDSYYVYSHWSLVQPGEGWYTVSNEEPELTQRPRWITDRQPTEADGNKDGAVRIRKYPKKSMGAHVHWTHIGPGVPWEHTNDWVNDASSQTGHQEEVEVPVVLAAGQVWKRSDGKTVTLKEVVGIGGEASFFDGDYWYDQGSVYVPGIPALANIHLAEHLEFVPAKQEALTAPVVRVFASIHRTYLPDHGAYVIDAIADDGTAWSRVVEIGSSGNWLPHPPLPQPD